MIDIFKVQVRYNTFNKFNLEELRFLFILFPFQLNSIPVATHRETLSLTGVVQGHIATVVTQVAVPGVAGTGLSRTPPGTVAANVEEWNIGVTVAGRKTCKTAFVGSISPFIPPTFAFHFISCHLFTT